MLYTYIWQLNCISFCQSDGQKVDTGGIGLTELWAVPGVCRELPRWVESEPTARLPLLDSLICDILQQGGQARTETPSRFGLQTPTPPHTPKAPGWFTECFPNASCV